MLLIDQDQCGCSSGQSHFGFFLVTDLGQSKTVPVSCPRFVHMVDRYLSSKFLVSSLDGFWENRFLRTNDGRTDDERPPDDSISAVQAQSSAKNHLRYFFFLFFRERVESFKCYVRIAKLLLTIMPRSFDCTLSGQGARPTAPFSPQLTTCQRYRYAAPAYHYEKFWGKKFCNGCGHCLLDRVQMICEQRGPLLIRYVYESMGIMKSNWSFGYKWHPVLNGRFYRCK